MAYATPNERNSLIAGLRALTKFLEDHPRVPVPRTAYVMVFPPTTTDRDARKEVDVIAELIESAVVDKTSDGSHYTTSRSFGPVQYHAIAIPAYSKNTSTAKSEEAR